MFDQKQGSSWIPRGNLERVISVLSVVLHFHLREKSRSLLVEKENSGGREATLERECVLREEDRTMG